MRGYDAMDGAAPCGSSEPLSSSEQRSELARENPQTIVYLANTGRFLSSGPNCVLFLFRVDGAPKINSTLGNDYVDYGAFSNATHGSWSL